MIFMVPGQLDIFLYWPYCWPYYFQYNKNMKCKFFESIFKYKQAPIYSSAVDGRESAVKLQEALFVSIGN